MPEFSTYITVAAAHHEWDPECPIVAAEICREVQNAVGDRRRVEHVGSSSVPGMPGKNIIDLALEAEPGDVPGFVTALVEIGWQRQTEPWAHPATRPMLYGAFDRSGRRHLSHLHIVGAAEFESMVRFREALRADPALRDRYAERKREVLASGVTEGHLYADAKSDVVEAILDEGERR